MNGVKLDVIHQRTVMVGVDVYNELQVTKVLSEIITNEVYVPPKCIKSYGMCLGR